MRRARRGFTLIELMIACALSAILIGVLAATFQYVTRAYDASLDRLDVVRNAAATLERLDADWGRAVAAPVAGAAGVEAQLADAPVTIDWNGAPVALRHDQLTLLALEPVDADGDGASDQTRLVRLRWSVAWDAAREEGTLVRTASPASVPGAALPTLAAEEREELLRGVLEVRFQLWLDAPGEGEAFRDPPPAAGLPGYRARLVYQGDDAALLSYALCTTTPLSRLEPGAVVRLEDTRSPARFDAGLYAARARQVVTGDGLPPNRLVLTVPPGDAAGGVRYSAAWLPSAAYAIIDVRTTGPRGPLARRVARSLLRRATVSIGGP